MGVQERRAREKKELRQGILDAAREMFVRDGFENVSMRKIAEKIEYSPTTIYLYFQDKADLLDCLCEETFAKLLKKQNILDQTIADPLERLRRGAVLRDLPADRGPGRPSLATGGRRPGDGAGGGDDAGQARGARDSRLITANRFNISSQRGSRCQRFSSTLAP